MLRPATYIWSSTARRNGTRKRIDRFFAQRSLGDSGVWGTSVVTPNRATVIGAQKCVYILCGLLRTSHLGNIGECGVPFVSGALPP